MARTKGSKNKKGDESAEVPAPLQPLPPEQKSEAEVEASQRQASKDLEMHPKFSKFKPGVSND